MSGDSEPSYARFGSGRAVRRIEDRSLVQGAGLYADDANLPGQAYLVFLRSPYAHARIVSIDLQGALALPGVIRIYTGRELVAAGVKPIPGTPAFRRPGGGRTASPPRHVLAPDTVRFVGEAVAAIVAESRDQARDALLAVTVEYEELPAVADGLHAAMPDAALVWPDASGNVCAELRHGDIDATAACFARATHVVSLDLVNQRVAPCAMEPRAVLASYDPSSERITLRMSSQMPAGVRNTLCDEILKIPRDKVRVLVGDVGGGFGMKTGIYPEDVVAAFATRDLIRPIKWLAERGEEFVAANHGRDLFSHAELALDENARILALRVRSRANVGAYATATGLTIQLMIGPWVSTSIYDIGTIDIQVQAVLSNNAPTGAYRGAGRPETIYIMERLMDAAARQIGADGAELRRKNMISPAQMPYTNAMGQIYDSGNFASIQDQALDLADWVGFPARLAASKARNRLRGRGIASFLEWTGGNVFEERVTVNILADGYIELASATQAMGQGIATSYAQLAVDVFQVPIEKIRIVQGDTDRATGFGSAGSRSLFTGGSALRVAALRTITHSTELAARALEAAPADIEYLEGRFQVLGTDHGIDLFELAGKQPEAQIFIDSTSAVEGPSWPNASHICEVEVDPETGQVEIASYASVNDVGRVVNPTIVTGQIEGGAVQGIGQALSEAMVYDADSAQALSASFLDYAIPHAGIVMRFQTVLDQSTPCLTNPLGVKGVGELGTIGATPAVVNAVVDALARAGLGTRAHAIDMPLTSERVWRALRNLEGTKP